MDEIEAKLQEVVERIETLVWQHDIGYIEACVMLAEEDGIEEDVLGKIILLHQPLMGKIREEAENLRFLAREHRLED